jgi:hypothetical protein
MAAVHRRTGSGLAPSSRWRHWRELAMLRTVDSEMPMAVSIRRVLKAPLCSCSDVCRSLLMVTLAVGYASSGQKNRAVCRALTTQTPPGVRHHAVPLSALSSEACWPSRENALRPFNRRTDTPRSWELAASCCACRSNTNRSPCNGHFASEKIRL